MKKICLNHLKRKLSLLLSLCMVIGLLPAMGIVSSAAEPVPSLYFDFTKAYIASALNIKNYPPTITYDFTSPVGGTIEKNPTIESEPWAYHSKSASDAVSYHYMLANQGITLYGGSSFSPTGNLKIKVTKSGLYKPTAHVLVANPGGTGIVRLHGYNAVTDEIGAVLAESVDFNSYADYTGVPDGTVTPLPLGTNALFLEEGEYILSCQGTGTYATGAGRFNFTVNGFELEADMALAAQDTGVLTGSTVSIPLSAMLTDETPVDLSTATLSAVSRDVTVATVAVGADGKSIDVTGVAEGKAVIDVTATSSAIEGKTAVTVTVLESQGVPAYNLHYDFKKGYVSAAWDYIHTNGISYGNTTVGHVDELNSEISSDPWEFHSYGGTPASGTNYLSYVDGANSGMVLYGGSSLGALARIKISVPASGLYMPVAVIYSRSDGGKCKGSLREYNVVTDEPGEIIARLRELSTNSGVMGVDAGATVEVPLYTEPIFLEAGEYIFQWENTWRDSSVGESYRSGMDGFKLYSEIAVSDVNVAIDGDVAVGAQKKLSVIGDAGGGLMVDLSRIDASISYESSATGIATVDGSGVVKGISEGTAVILAEVNVNGDIFTDSVTVTVTPAPAPELSSIAVTTLPTKTEYRIGEALDITGLVVTGTYTDSSTQIETVTLADITGFDSSTDAPSQTLTVTVDGKTATFDVKIVRVLDSISATGRITIDGYADEPAWEINKTLTRSKSGGDNAATFGTLWDEDNLYVFVDVVDNVLVTGSNKHYYDDGVEVYIDGDMVKGAYNEHSAQYTFRYGDDTVYVATANTVPPTASTEGVEHKTVETANGYAMEIKIPWSNIGGLTVNAGETIGFTIHVNDKDTPDDPGRKVEDILTYTLESDDADFEDWLDSTNWAEMTLDAWSNPVEDSNDTGTVSIGAEGAPAGAITATVNGIPVDISNPGDLTLGDVVEMNADPEPDAGKKFLFWMDPVSKRLVSNQQQVTFTVGTDTQITAVYKDAGQGHIVIFFDRNGKVLNPDSYYYDSGDEIVQPENPYSVGYIFSGWSPAVPATANGDYAFVAQYTDDPAMYTVAVENGSISPSGGSYKYNTQVTVTAGDFESGRKFAYWTKDGVIVSYSSEYSFYVWDDTEIRAVSVPADETVTAAPAIYMDDNVKNDGESGRLIFASERTLPAGYTLIETGILISELNSNPDLDNCDEKAVAQSESGSGQFTARVDGLDSDDSRYARAYMIYKTPEGEYKVIYSNAVIGTV